MKKHYKKVHVCIIFLIQLSNATTDEQVIGILTKDSSLDILQELGYTSVPHMETIATAKRLIQYVQ